MSEFGNYQLIINLSWNKVNDDAARLARLIHPQLNHKHELVAVTRGGLVPAAILAHELGIKRVETVGISSYHATNAPQAIRTEERQNAKFVKSLNGKDDGLNKIFIDDLTDTGQTFQLLRKHYPKAILCSLYAKPAGASTADFYIESFSQSVWLNFPWEHYSPSNSANPMEQPEKP